MPITIDLRENAMFKDMFAEIDAKQENTHYTEKRKAIFNLYHNLKLEPSLIASVYEMSEKEVQTMLDRGEL